MFKKNEHCNEVHNPSDPISKYNEIENKIFNNLIFFIKKKQFFNTRLVYDKISKKAVEL